MRDPTPPICVAYRVRDGWHRLLDVNFQSDTSVVKAQWRSAMFDLESLMDHFVVELVDQDTGANIAGPFNVGKDTLYAFSLLNLVHGQRVKTVVTGVNRANAAIDCSTNGIFVDLTPAQPADVTSNPVSDGNSLGLGFLGEDLDYTVATRSAFVSWAPFVDPESGISHFYAWAEAPNGTLLSERVFANKFVSQWTLPIPERQHGDRYRVAVRVVNGAGNARDFRSDAVEVDVTPPEFLTPVTFRITPSSVGLEPHIIADETAQVQLDLSVGDTESGVDRCRFALGTYPDGSDLSGVITVEANSLGGVATTRTRGNYEICSRQGECVDIPESQHTVYETLTVSKVMNEGFPLLNGFTMFAWVSCLNAYVRVAALL